MAAQQSFASPLVIVLLVLAVFGNMARSVYAISFFCDDHKPFAGSPVTCTADNGAFESDATPDVTCCFTVEQKGAIVQAAKCIPVRTSPYPYVATFTFTPGLGRQFVNANCCAGRTFQGVCEMGGAPGVPLNTAFIGGGSLTINAQPAPGGRKLVGFKNTFKKSQGRRSRF